MEYQKTCSNQYELSLESEQEGHNNDTFFWQKHFFQSFGQINSKNSKSQITGITHLHLKCSGRLKNSQHELFVVLVDCDLASCCSFGLSILHGPMAMM